MGPVTGYATSPDGTRIGFERSGEGPPLVLVHGTSADRTRWAGVLPAFAERFTVYAVDRRGRGLSVEVAEYALEREYEDIAAVADSIGGQVAVLGHSFGALVALEAALRSQAIARLVLYEPPCHTEEPLYPEGSRERLEAFLAAGDRDGALAMFFREVVGATEEQLAALRSAPSWQGRIAAAHTVPREFADGDYEFEPARFGSLTIPVVFLQGTESPLSLRLPTDLMHAALPSSSIVTIPGEAHIAMTTSPELFARLALEALAA